MRKLIPALILSLALLAAATPASAKPKAPPCPVQVSGSVDVSAVCGLLSSLQAKVAVEKAAVSVQAVLDGALKITAGLVDLGVNVVLPQVLTVVLSLPTPVISLVVQLPSIGLHLVLLCLLG